MSAETGESSPGRGLAVHAASLWCDACDQVTEHRILRLDPVARGRGGTLQGVARCRNCRTVHPFRSEAPGATELVEVVSEGARSTARRLELPAAQRLQVGSEVPGTGHLIHRLQDRTGRSVSEGTAGRLASVWTTASRACRVRVSLVEGRTTRPATLVVSPLEPLTIGEPITIDGRIWRIRAIRAAGFTDHDPGRTVAAGRVQRLYAGRIVNPPAGRSAWSRDREIPSAPASSTSRAARSRSSPGTSRNRTAPRARIAEGGPTHQSVRP